MIFPLTGSRVDASFTSSPLVSPRLSYGDRERGGSSPVVEKRIYLRTYDAVEGYLCRFSRRLIKQSR